MNILLCLSHSIEEYDQVKLLSSLGYNVFSLGGYIDPRAPHDPKRPALPWADFAERAQLQEVVDSQGVDDNIGAATAYIPNEILGWADVVIYHHYLQRLYGQWDHLDQFRSRGGRIIWRTVGQSTEANEREAQVYRARGMEIVRYSPKEENIPGYAGANAMIRFYKDPEEWNGWTGDPISEEGWVSVGNVTQQLAQRRPWTNPDFYLKATAGLPNFPAGPGSGSLPGGLGELDYEEMQDYLRTSRCYMYCGTQPASYTLGLLEALMTGVPVVSIGPSHMRIFPYGPGLFEGHELSSYYSDDPDECNRVLQVYLGDRALAERIGQHQRWRTIQEFGMEKVGAQWRSYLGSPRLP